MAILIANSMIQRLAPPAAAVGDWGTGQDAAGYTPVGEPVRGAIVGPSASALAASEGSSVSYVWSLLLDPCDVDEDMRVREVATGEEWDVIEVRDRRRDLMPYIALTISRAEGTA